MSGIDRVPAMAFYHPDGLVAAWKQARSPAFMGKKGRIATLPDIVEARLGSYPDGAAWRKYFTTLSAEYMGFGSNGGRILIVAHGIGPMATLDGILKAYSYEYNDKERNHRGGRITEEQFRDLEMGKYGDVEIVDLEEILDWYKYPFLEQLSAGEALWEPLLRARLGCHYDDYIERHESFARDWHKIRGHETIINPMPDPQIIKMGDAANCGYAYHLPKDGSAIAHLLAIGGLMEVSSCGSRLPSLVCDVGCHEWWNGVRLVGVRNGAEVKAIHPGIGHTFGLLKRHWRALLRPAREPPVSGFHPLIKLDKGVWFTQCSKRGAGMDTFEPEFSVRQIKYLGQPVKFTSEILGYYGFYKYDIRALRLLAPPEANSYYLVGEAENVWEDGDPVAHTHYVQFCRSKIDYSQRLIRENQLANDPDLIKILLEAEEGEEWR